MMHLGMHIGFETVIPHSQASRVTQRHTQNCTTLELPYWLEGQDEYVHIA